MSLSGKCVFISTINTYRYAYVRKISVVTVRSRYLSAKPFCTVLKPLTAFLTLLSSTEIRESVYETRRSRISVIFDTNARIAHFIPSFTDAFYTVVCQRKSTARVYQNENVRFILSVLFYAVVDDSVFTVRLSALDRGNSDACN